MRTSLSLKCPLKINNQRTEEELNEQEYIMHLCMELMRAIRNQEVQEPNQTGLSLKRILLIFFIN